ncbi:MAG: PHP domain-containing protein [Clostridia bacterium]|nr:PHP domain-containing protein [Clostridia bacterium]
MSLENKRCDLHTHSTYSDGTWTPEEIIREAKRLDLAVALTDHNMVQGLPEFMRAAEKYGVEAVGGAELSCDFEGREVHMLALFIPESAYGAVMEYTEPMRRHKKESNRILAENLAAAGYPIDLDKLVSADPKRYVNRAHFADEMVKLGYVKTRDEAFATLLSPEYGYYIPCPRPAVEDTVSFIRSIGAVAVFAHPYLDFTDEELCRIIPAAKTAGLAGMETSYSEYSPETQATAEDTAKQYGLLMSGGSDFHGDIKPHISLMTGTGELFVPYEYYLKIKEYSVG